METRKEVSSILADPARRDDLLHQMDAVIAQLPESDPEYQRRVNILADLHAYVEG